MGPSEHRSNGNEQILHIPQSSQSLDLPYLFCHGQDESEGQFLSGVQLV